MIQLRNGLFLLLFLIAMHFGSLSAMAQQDRVTEQKKSEGVFGQVTYIAADAIYINIGADNGIGVGDTLVVRKNHRKAILLQVMSLSSKSASAKVVSPIGEVAVGDTVTSLRAKSLWCSAATDSVSMKQAKTDTTLLQANTPPPKQERILAQATETPVSLLPQEEGNTIRGRFSLQYYSMNSIQYSEFNFYQAGAVLDFNIERIAGSYFNLSLYVNSRYDLSEQLRSSFGNSARFNARFYQFVLEYKNPNARFGFCLGRFSSPYIAGVGIFDGGVITYSNGNFQVGILGGTQPGYVNSEVQSDNKKFAAYVSYEAGDYSSTKVQSSVAFAQQYYLKHADRAFFYIQNSLFLGNQFNIFQNAEIDLNDFQNGQRLSKPRLSNLFLSVGYRPLNWFNLTAGYSGRRNVRMLEFYEFIPDSLFDYTMFHDVRASVGLRFPYGVYLTGSSSLRMHERYDRNSLAHSIGLQISDILGTSISSYLRYSMNDNVYNKSNSISLDLSRDILDNLYVTIKGERYYYSLTSSTYSATRYSLGADVLYRISNLVYSLLNIERVWDREFGMVRAFVETGVRF